MLFILLLFDFIASLTAILYPLHAKAQLYFDLSNISTIGTLYFTQINSQSPVFIHGTLKGLPPHHSYRGFHVHEQWIDRLINSCTAAGPHFNPYNHSHGAQKSPSNQRHVGDLGNILTDQNGYAVIHLTDPIIRLDDGNQSIINRTIVIHQDVDDFGLGQYPDSKTTGHVGSHVACGVIYAT
ncbi:unnamed protein product [Didymodactylos carnosus]|uniref:Superoxide dismutase copper/zinc binding domain-containing protein n=1 Tax=Didymodactylos carnosus TaxID=1234261 RepID=A0A813ZHY5_9BILA|nr:unnamed protein product [Didymodactylos carnosus]CAF0898571.1 unnamed protein product [Didymodactylos carnosus]CAF3566853.1 unnamed protein product [Didymodactylos carnosus]CAF3681409.1 unnamed protein product [Didymodactylos carnosus]